jgi:hypothetical protein
VKDGGFGWFGSKNNRNHQAADQFLLAATDLLQAFDEMHPAAGQQRKWKDRSYPTITIPGQPLEVNPEEVE